MPKYTALKARYSEQLQDEPPPGIEGEAWSIFLAHVRDGRTYKQIGETSGLSPDELKLLVSRVKRRLETSDGGRNEGELTPESPIEHLAISTRSRNALRQLGCDTVRSILEHDFTRGRMRLGRVSRQEIAAALTERGFMPPPTLAPPAGRADDLAEALTRLRDRMEHAYQLWREQLARLEKRLSDSSKRQS